MPGPEMPEPSPASPFVYRLAPERGLEGTLAPTSLPQGQVWGLTSTVTFWASKPGCMGTSARVLWAPARPRLRASSRRCPLARATAAGAQREGRLGGRGPLLMPVRPQPLVPPGLPEASRTVPVGRRRRLRLRVCGASAAGPSAVGAVWPHCASVLGAVGGKRRARVCLPVPQAQLRRQPVLPRERPSVRRSRRDPVPLLTSPSEGRRSQHRPGWCSAPGALYHGCRPSRSRSPGQSATPLRQAYRGP